MQANIYRNIRCAATNEGIEACFYEVHNRSRVVIDARTGNVVEGATNIPAWHDDFRPLVKEARKHVAR